MTAYEGCDIGCPICWATHMGIRRAPKMLLKEPFEVLNLRKATVFINSAHDFLAPCIPGDWVRTLFKWIEAQRPGNVFYLQSKNVGRIIDFLEYAMPVKDRVIFGTTIETNKTLYVYNAVISSPSQRAYALRLLRERGYRTRLSLEPLYDFDLETMMNFLTVARPEEIMAGLDNYAHKHKQIIPGPKMADYDILRNHITWRLKISLIEKDSLKAAYREWLADNASGTNAVSR